ncbi:hypothetical protein [Botrimarina mediterranea]|uniref:hypothetical protein n=1 Tax=Botrimarina mediterranea TaxID=2528022 RepID=UPI0011A19E77
MSPSHSQRGNVLFLILIAVALFAALSFAVVRATSTSTVTPSAEKARTIAAQLLNQGLTMKVAYQRLRLRCDVRKIDFYPLHGHNPNRPLDDSCSLLHPNGGGLDRSQFIAPQGVQTPGASPAFWVPSQYVRIPGVGIDDSAAAELTFVLRYVTPEICQAYNALSIGESTLDPSIPSNLNSATYTGDFATWDTANQPISYGQPIQCVAETNGNTGIYGLLYVLEAR